MRISGIKFDEVLYQILCLGSSRSLFVNGFELLAYDKWYILPDENRSTSTSLPNVPILMAVFPTSPRRDSKDSNAAWASWNAGVIPLRKVSKRRQDLAYLHRFIDFHQLFPSRLFRRSCLILQIINLIVDFAL